MCYLTKRRFESSSGNKSFYQAVRKQQQKRTRQNHQVSKARKSRSEFPDWPGFRPHLVQTSSPLWIHKARMCDCRSRAKNLSIRSVSAVTYCKPYRCVLGGFCCCCLLFFCFDLVVRMELEENQDPGWERWSLSCTWLRYSVCCPWSLGSFTQGVIMQQILEAQSYFPGLLSGISCEFLSWGRNGFCSWLLQGK